MFTDQRNLEQETKWLKLPGPEFQNRNFNMNIAKETLCHRGLVNGMQITGKFTFVYPCGRIIFH